MVYLYVENGIHNKYYSLLFMNNVLLEHYLKALLSIMGWPRALRYVIVIMTGYHDEKKSTCCMRSFIYSWSPRIYFNEQNSFSLSRIWLWRMYNNFANVFWDVILLPNFERTCFLFVLSIDLQNIRRIHEEIQMVLRIFR